MNKLLKLGSIPFALGLLFVGVDSVDAQTRRETRENRREYRRDVRDARREYRDDIRDGDSRRESLHEYRDNVRDARREYRRETREDRRDYRRDVRRGRDGWYWYSNGRRYVRPYSQWNYRNGWFFRVYYR